MDARRGSDRGDGSQAAPWKTVAHGITRLKPGDTLVLHAGVYYEAVTVSARGTAKAPITLRAAPGELAIIDGGLAEFATSPRTAWEPAPGGAPGEFRSVSRFPAIDVASGVERGVWVTGNFADTMIPLHGYKFAADLRATNEYWNIENSRPGHGIYVGPGVWFDWETHRIHVRLAPTTLASQPNYAGERDPRKLALVIGVDRTPLRIVKAEHVRIQDLVLRGATVPTLALAHASHVTLDGLTVYGGSPAIHVRSTNHLQLVRSRVRGLAAPWSSRASMKYRGASPYLFIADSALPQSRDWEIAYNELTDSHDGIVVDSIKRLRFHHNLVDNFNDDALYLTLVPRHALPEDVQIYENLVTRAYTALAFGELGRGAKNPIGRGVYIFRNVFDLRVPAYVWIAKDGAADRKYQPTHGRMCGDHGSPIWEPMFFYNNTVLTAANAWRDYYGAQLVSGMAGGTMRRLFNNIFVQAEGEPGFVFANPDDDLEADGNLHWGVRTGPTRQDAALRRFRSSPMFGASRQSYDPGYAAHDVMADPRFVGPHDVRLQPASPAIDRGLVLPATWPDTLRRLDKGPPDLGALPAGAPPLRVGPAAAPRT